MAATGTRYAEVTTYNDASPAMQGLARRKVLDRFKKSQSAIDAGLAFPEPQTWWPELAPLTHEEREWVKAQIDRIRKEAQP